MNNSNNEAAEGDVEPGHIEVIWRCEVGGKIYGTLPRAADQAMREAIGNAFKALAGVYPEFTFSGWGAELTETKRAVVGCWCRTRHTPSVTKCPKCGDER